MKKYPWNTYVNCLTSHDRRRLLDIVIERLIETEELKFRSDDTDTLGWSEECFYWPGSGDNVLEE